MNIHRYIGDGVGCYTGSYANCIRLKYEPAT